MIEQKATRSNGTRREMCDVSGDEGKFVGKREHPSTAPNLMARGDCFLLLTLVLVKSRCRCPPLVNFRANDITLFARSRVANPSPSCNHSQRLPTRGPTPRAEHSFCLGRPR